MENLIQLFVILVWQEFKIQKYFSFFFFLFLIILTFFFFFPLFLDSKSKDFRYQRIFPSIYSTRSIWKSDSEECRNISWIWNERRCLFFCPYSLGNVNKKNPLGTLYVSFFLFSSPIYLFYLFYFTSSLEWKKLMHQNKNKNKKNKKLFSERNIRNWIPSSSRQKRRNPRL